ncbi:MAG: flippase [Candidatus Goldbacteria bacterium]|nr:flippase [Candidatus Goldiibacteriota bacterium]
MLIRYLGTEKQGVYAYIITTVSLFGFIADLGINNFLIRETKISGENASVLFGNAIVVQAIQIIVAVCCVNIYAVFFEHDIVTRHNLMIASLAFAVNFAAQPYIGVINSYEKMHVSALAISIASVLNAFFIFAAVLMKMQITGIIIMIGMANMANYFISRYLCTKEAVKPRFVIDGKVIKWMFKMSVPFALIGVFNYVYTRLDVLILYKLTNPEQAGYYTAVTKILDILIAIVASIALPLYPRISYLMNNVSKDKAMETMRIFSKYMAAFTAPFVLAVSMFAGDYTEILFGREYLKSSFVLSVLVWNVFLLSITIALGYIVNAARLTQIVACIYCFNMVLSIVLNIILVPRYSYFATTLINFMCVFLAFCGILVITNVKVGSSGLKQYMPKVIVSMAAEFAAVMLLTNRVHFLLASIIGIFVYLTAIILTGYFVHNEVDIIKDAIFIKRHEEKYG